LGRKIKLTLNTQEDAEIEVPYSGAYVFLVMAFGMIALILVILLGWPEEVEQLFGPLQTSHPLFMLAV